MDEERIKKEFMAPSSGFACMRDLEAIRREMYEIKDNLRRELTLQVANIEKSTAIATTEMNRRLEGMNEFRAQLTKQEANFMTKDRFESLHNEFGKRIELLENSITNLTTKERLDAVYKEIKIDIGALQTFAANINGRIIGTGAVIGTVLLLLGLILHWFKI